MKLNAARLLVALNLMLTLLLASCSDSDSNRTESEVRQSLESLQDKVTFGLLVPTYIPEGTSRTAEGLVNDGEVTYWLAAVSDQSLPLHQRATVNVIQRNAEGAPTPLPSHLRPSLAPDFPTSTLVAGANTFPQRTESEGNAFIQYSARVHDRHLTLVLSWRVEDSEQVLKLSEEMEAEALRVFESIIENEPQGSRANVRTHTLVVPWLSKNLV